MIYFNGFFNNFSGLRNGGGIGDVLRPPSHTEQMFSFRVIYDMLFFFIVIIIVLNLIFGVIIDTFADLRSEKQQKEETLKNSCFICGLERKAFDNKNVTFEEHIRMEHNMWHYLNFVVLIKVKDPTEFTGPESYVHEMVKVNMNFHAQNVTNENYVSRIFYSFLSFKNSFNFFLSVFIL